MSSNSIPIPHDTNELISDEVKDIINYRPHWMIRQGNVLFFVIVLALLVLTWFIRYPDKITASARLVALNAPKMIVAKTEGKLIKLLVRNEAKVSPGQNLAWLQSTASHEQVLQLQNWVEQVYHATRDGNLQALHAYPLPALSQLGDLNSSYLEFQSHLLEAKQLLSSGYYQKKKDNLYKDLMYLSELKANTIEQRKLLEQDKQLQKKEFDAYELLAKEKVIAPLELNEYKSKLLAKEQNMEQMAAQITNSELSSHNKRKEILELQKNMADQEQRFYSSLLSLMSNIETWIQQYILKAPEAGKVYYINSLQENQLLSSGQELFYVQSSQSQFYAEMMAAQNGLGKVKVGQKVLLRAESHPDTEYGYLEGTVNYISNLPNREDSFLINLDLPHGLRTNYNKEIFFRNKLAAKAEIITNDKRLLDRLLGELQQVLRN